MEAGSVSEITAITTLQPMLYGLCFGMNIPVAMKG